MAKLIPALSSVTSKMTAGERRFAQRLESHLEDDYLCWYGVPVGSRAIHPDFLILNPRRGLLVLEVKDWKADTIQSIDRFSVTLSSTGAKSRRRIRSSRRSSTPTASRKSWSGTRRFCRSRVLPIKA